MPGFTFDASIEADGCFSKSLNSDKASHLLGPIKGEATVHHYVTVFATSFYSVGCLAMCTWPFNGM